jgi:oxalate decarboxylase/phosphoglucose isomerase-like protein (cupin superfamily)
MNGSRKNNLEIKHNGEVIFRKINTSSLPNGLTFFSSENEFLQIGSWRYPEGQSLQRHFHNRFDRIINRTHEIIIVLSGSVEISVYSLNLEFLKKINLISGEIGVVMNCGHGYKILEPETRVIEIKNGPYAGPDKDRERF